MTVEPEEKPAPAPRPNEPLVEVFHTFEMWKADVIRGALESEGIRVSVQGETALRALNYGMDVFDGVVVWVLQSDAARARQVVAGFFEEPDAEPEEEA